MHRAAHAALGLNWTYHAVECRAEDLARILAAARAGEWGGYGRARDGASTARGRHHRRVLGPPSTRCCTRHGGDEPRAVGFYRHRRTRLLIRLPLGSAPGFPGVRHQLAEWESLVSRPREESPACPPPRWAGGRAAARPPGRRASGRYLTRTTCGSWSLAWSANSALMCTTS
ncbi:hypothetical protein OG627_24965 [Streptomyces sp. NBC_01429]